jgi:hypothetical protein
MPLSPLSGIPLGRLLAKSPTLRGQPFAVR